LWKKKNNSKFDEDGKKMSLNDVRKSLK
jgi:hypothetical protein